ncbi:dihydroorotate dehydrogenase [Rubricella aquisinus]|uniref:Dihydroorotate dehydrogenase (quinone) n=1 Tax=Rubricella aquisinus TaxID=2028108 RepID=A0A840WLQ1_9RHOB|nr:quinone-dependent dihydroorotate dehydrogenase [Rubricella aquisinus]MBB5516018.1 dihydroorotate dehydrogenase [Rubricella aquisinus]
MTLEQIGLPLLRAFDPETAHGLAIRALRAGLAPQPGPVTSARLATTVAGLHLPNPVGLAAGFDKNAQAVQPLLNAGFGFIEVGAATPRPQPGNPKPRLFRLSEDHAAINRFGFNNDGMEAIAKRLEAPRTGILGINLGANKDSADRAVDFATVLSRMAHLVDFATVNVSSPNTEKLRDLQGPAALSALLERVMAVRGTTPVFLKIAPDLTDQDIADIARVARDAGIQGIIATNTTLNRDGLTSPHRVQKGGLSGAPLMDRATEVLRQLYTETDGTIPLIGVGGIASGADAYAKIRAGASAVQLYTALVFHGIGLAARIARDLDALLQADGFAHVSAAIGADHT